MNSPDSSKKRLRAAVLGGVIAAIGSGTASYCAYRLKHSATEVVATPAPADASAVPVPAEPAKAKTVPDTLPDITLTDRDGKPTKLASFGGRPLMLNFWATWCAPCREEVPMLVAAKEQWASKGFEVVGIGIDSADKIREFSKTYQINYPVLVADGSALELLRKLGNRGGGLPYSVVLDRTGGIAERHLGALTAEDLRRVLESLFG